MSLIFVLIAAAFVIWALVDIFRSKLPTNKKIIWFVVVILFPLVGSIVYFFLGRK